MKRKKQKGILTLEYYSGIKKVIWMDVKKNSIEQNEPASTE